MSDPDRLTSHDDKTFGRDTRGLFLRIFVVACLGVLFRQSIASDKTSSFSAAACGRSGFRRWPTRVDHLIGCMIDAFATRTLEIASGRGVELILTS
jgi:hypothetical protein